MADMPSEIWVWDMLGSEQTGNIIGRFGNTPDSLNRRYIRADVVEARIAEAVAKEREACARVLDEKAIFWTELAQDTPRISVELERLSWAENARQDAAAIRSRT